MIGGAGTTRPLLVVVRDLPACRADIADHPRRHNYRRAYITENERASGQPASERWPLAAGAVGDER